ncbi:hypothetical protein RGU70_07795 [Herbaspirillum sp. RTI4]|uniref:hypothetical protein n=1 Tax=Herbaspirillum sp. RTI4 TaxID=3048640 RepID=UPI002AB56264|nr:hypothetical protein [Herbaspirillum sp. RTI4]MDY7578220.1 hypothetical protein [Herbaspirillum sp. RTI4]MEA9981558.1 hypothetical protein [Herbaspirillum sp. RTI4]
MTDTTSSQAEQYKGKVTAVGNSKGIRFEAAFFKAHPEFNGEVRATVLASGQVLLSAVAGVRLDAIDNDNDPVMLSFLQFMEEQMLQHPELIETADKAQLLHIAKLIDGVSTGSSADAHN